MQYEATAQDNGSSRLPQIQKNMLVKAAKKLSTMQLLWIITVRHKFALVSIMAIGLGIQQVFPPFFDIVKSII